MARTNPRRTRPSAEPLEGRDLTTSLATSGIITIYVPAGQTTTVGGRGVVFGNPNPEDPGEPRGPLGPVSLPGLTGFKK
jgi:hypothetical protein